MCLCKPEIRTPWCEDCQEFAYGRIKELEDGYYDKRCRIELLEEVLDTKGQRIKELESNVLDLQSELARKKMSLTVACNRVEELEGKLKVAVEALRRLAKSGDGTHPDRHASFYDCLPTLQIEFSERKQLAAEAIEQLGELK